MFKTFDPFPFPFKPIVDGKFATDPFVAKEPAESIEQVWRNDLLFLQEYQFYNRVCSTTCP